MDLDLDNDLEFENDRIKSFLHDKLQVIKVSNKKVQEMIEKRKQIFSHISESEDTLKEAEFVKVLLCWKKIYNNKCAFGFEVQNCSDSNLGISKIFLKWDSPACLEFNTHIFQEEDLSSIENKTSVLSQCTDIKTKAYVVLVLNVPQFIHNLSYTLKGNIFFKKGKTDLILNLPNLEITSLDITNNKLSAIVLQNGSVYDFLTVKICSLKIDFVMILPEASTANLSSLFEIHCFLTSVNFTKPHNRYFTAYKICPTFDNSLIEVHNSNDRHMCIISVYIKNDEMLTAILHYLHLNIPGIIIIPKSCFDSYDICKIFEKFNKQDELNTFKTCIKREIAVVHSYKQYLESTRKDCDICLHLRKKLLDAEKDTDLSYLKIISNI